MNVRLATLGDVEALISLRIQLLEVDDAGFDDALRVFLEASREGQPFYEEFGFRLTRGMELTLVAK